MLSTLAPIVAGTALGLQSPPELRGGFYSLLRNGSQTPNRFRKYGVQPEVSDEVAELVDKGYDIRLVNPTPRVSDPVKEAQVDGAIDTLSERKDCVDHLFRPEVHPMGADWLVMAKRAAALWILQAGDRAEYPSQGIDPADFHRPHFRDGLSALDLQRISKGDAKTERIWSRHERFLASRPEGDGEDEFGLRSIDYLRHVLDARAVRSRADATIDVILDHVRSKEQKPERLVSASLACGAAAPVYEIASALAEIGIELDMKLVDGDSMALAAALSLGKNVFDLSSQISIHHQDLLGLPLTSYIQPHSVDVVDILGLFEYIPKRVCIPKGVGISPFSYNAASDLLASVKDIVRPGGIIVFGNMLEQRAQQGFFDQVWPRLEQRNITTTLGIIEKAGYDMRNVSVHIPQNEGVYAIYAIKVPEDRELVHVRGVRQEIARRIIRLADY